MTATLLTDVLDRDASPTVGVHRGMSFALYHALAAASNSRLTQLRRSPAHLRAYLDGPRVETKATLLGSAIHSAILEPDDFDARYCIAERCEAKTGKGEQCRNGGSHFHADAGWLCGTHAKAFAGFDEARIVLSAEDYAICRGVRDSAYRHPNASKLLRAEGDTELTVVWRDSETGLACKVRLDKVAARFASILDLKSTRDASPRAFERDVYLRGYYIQSAWYLDGAKAAGLDVRWFVNIALEKEPPYAVALYRMGSQLDVGGTASGALDIGREHARMLLRQYAECLRTNHWPAYSEEILDLSLPGWAISQIEADALRLAPPDDDEEAA